jgi:hypothetical protein
VKQSSTNTSNLLHLYKALNLVAFDDEMEFEDYFVRIDCSLAMTENTFAHAISRKNHSPCITRSIPLL